MTDCRNQLVLKKHRILSKTFKYLLRYYIYSLYSFLSKFSVGNGQSNTEIHVKVSHHGANIVVIQFWK